MSTQIQTRIQRLTGCTDDEYSELVFSLGMAYLEHYTDGDALGVTITSQASSFWAWYTNQWNIIDHRFLGAYAYDGTDAGVLDFLKREWIAAHQPAAMNVYPGKQVIDEAWAIMMGRVIDETHRKEVHHA